MKDDFIALDEGGGGAKSAELISSIRKIVKDTGKWKNTGDDGAVYDLGLFKNPSILPSGKTPPLEKRRRSGCNLVFTTDAFIVDPIFFPGGDIGKIAMCGTINDVSVMGARPIGVSLSIVMEEGFPRKDFEKILRSINKVSQESGVPVVTGDTKVTEKGKIDKIEITTAGIGIAERIIENGGIKVGDLIISSGDLGEHAVALLAKRFNYKTRIKTDSKVFNKELEKVEKYLNACKDPTRGGLAANLNEMAEKSSMCVILDEKTLPYKKEVVAITELLGLDKFSLASEGRFIASVSPKNADKVLRMLKKFNKEARIIGIAKKPKNKKEIGVFVKTKLGGERKIEVPRGRLIPRIC